MGKITTTYRPLRRDFALSFILGFLCLFMPFQNVPFCVIFPLTSTQVLTKNFHYRFAFIVGDISKLFQVFPKLNLLTNHNRLVVDMLITLPRVNNLRTVSKRRARQWHSARWAKWSLIQTTNLGNLSPKNLHSRLYAWTASGHLFSAKKSTSKSKCNASVTLGQIDIFTTKIRSGSIRPLLTITFVIYTCLLALKKMRIIW